MSRRTAGSRPAPDSPPAAAASGTADGPEVDAGQTTVYTVPTQQAEADGTLTWDATTLVVVRVHAAGQAGLGWTYGSPAGGTIRPGADGSDGSPGHGLLLRAEAAEPYRSG